MATQNSSDLTGMVLAGGQFRLGQLLGEGGMGSVYLAEQLGVGRHAVVKLMKAGVSDARRAELEERFQREARLVAHLNHPHLVHLYTFGRATSGQLYLAMEYVPGRTLRQVMQEDGQLTEVRTLRIIEQMCGALHEAHRIGIIHRDLKPDNVMLSPRHNNPDYVKVLDFGIAKLMVDTELRLTATGVVFGTPQYMAPEQVHGRGMDQRTDIYAVGAIAYELLTGQPVFDANSAVAVMMKHATAPVVPPSERRPGLHPRTEAVIQRCLEKSMAQRFADMLALEAEVQSTLRALEGSEGGRRSLLPSARNAQPALSSLGTAERWAQRRRSRLMLGVGLGVAAVVAFLLLRQGAGTLEVSSSALQPAVIPTDSEPRVPPPVVPEASGAGSPAGDIALTDPAKADDARLRLLADKYGAYVGSCFNGVVESVYLSRESYLDTVSSAATPRLRRHPPAVVVPDVQPCALAVAKYAADAQQPLDSSAERFQRAAQPLAELLKTTDRYYGQQEYRADGMAQGRELHRALLAAFPGFVSAADDLSVTLDAAGTQLIPWYQQQGTGEQRLMLEGDSAARTITRLGNVEFRRLGAVELPALRGAIQAYARVLEQLWRPSNDEFLDAAKALARRVERASSRPPERMRRSWMAERMLEGSPAALISEYNGMPALFAPLPRRQEVPFAMHNRKD
jgi:serine/threonine protein kinase